MKAHYGLNDALPSGTFFTRSDLGRKVGRGGWEVGREGGEEKKKKGSGNESF